MHTLISNDINIYKYEIYEFTKQLYWHAYEMYIKLLYTYFIFSEYLHMVYIISLKVILYVSQGI